MSEKLPLMALGNYSGNEIWVVPQKDGKRILGDRGFVEVGLAEIGVDDLNSRGGPCIGDSNSKYFDTRSAVSSGLTPLGFGNEKMVFENYKNLLVKTLSSSISGIDLGDYSSSDAMEEFVEGLMGCRKLEGNLIKVMASSQERNGIHYFIVPKRKSMKVSSSGRFSFNVGEETYKSRQQDFAWLEKGVLRQKKVGKMSIRSGGVAPIYWLNDNLFSELSEGGHISLDSDSGMCL